MAAPTTAFSSGTGTIATTGEANGLLLTVDTGLENPRVQFGFSGTFTSVVAAIRGRLLGLSNYYPVRAVNPNGPTAISDSTSIALVDSTNQSVVVDGTGYDYLEVYAVSGTPTAFTVEARQAAGQSPLTNVLNSTVTGTQTYTGASTVSVASATAFVVGPNGTTNPTFKVVTNTASAATGISITSAAAAGGVAVAVLSSGTNENLTIDAKGSGTISLNATGTGTVTIGSSLTVSAKNIITDTSTGTKIGTATTQKLGFFNATPVVQPAANTDTTTGAAGGTTTVYLNTTFTGAGGTAAYTLGGVVTALKALGLLAA